MKYKELLIYIIVFITSAVILTSWVFYLTQNREKNAKKTPVSSEQTVTFDKTVLDVIHLMQMEPTDVHRSTHPNAVYYYIHMDSINKLSETDRILRENLQGTNIVFNELLKSDNNQLIKSYYDTSNDQMFILDLHFFIPPPPVVVGKPQLCIIVDDFGNFDGPLLDAFCALETKITFAIIPGLPFTQIAMQKAVKAGHEVIIHIPMQPENESTDPGANAITSRMTEKEIYDRVRSFFAEIPAAKGANQHMGSLITQDRTLLRAALTYLAEKNYFFIDSRTTAQTVALEVSKDLGIAFEERNIFLDAPANSDAVLQDKLKDLQRLLDTKRRALVITHCHDRGRLERLKTFIDEAQKMGFEIVPASEYVKKRVES